MFGLLQDEAGVLGNGGLQKERIGIQWFLQNAAVMGTGGL